MNIVGIDPGLKGGIAVFSADGSIKTTKIDYDNLEKTLKDLTNCIVYIEKITPRPSDSVRSLVTSCINWGKLLEAIKRTKGQGLCPVFIMPGTWQAELGLRKRWQKPDPNMTDEKFMSWKYSERKKWHRRVAIEMFPNLKVTHQNADALLIGEYGRRSSSDAI